ncbi:MAG TPA: choice-of-anchor A family protein [Solirubrobacteraceae bacterium]
MQRWVVLAVTVLAGLLPASAAAADCAAPGIPGQYDVFAEQGFSGVNAQTQGRVAAGGDVFLQSFFGGQSLPSDPARVDLVVGRNLTVDAAGAGIWQGGVTYAGTLTPPTWNSTLSLRQAPPPFDFGAQFATLRERSAQWADLPAKGTVEGPTFDELTLRGTDPALNVFEVSSSKLGSALRVAINVPSGSTTLINVTGTTAYTSRLSSVSLTGATEATVLWNFPLTPSVVSTAGFEWKGSILAPNAAVSLSNGQLNGSVAARVVSVGASNGGYLVRHNGFTGCLPPAAPTPLSIASLCTDPVTNLHALRLRNTGSSTRAVTWTDKDSAQTGAFSSPGGTDTFFDVRDGDVVHHIVVKSGTTTLEQTTTTRPCAGTITVRKLVTGPGAAPPGPWRIHIDGDNGFSATRDLVDGAQSAVSVPGGYQAGSVPIGQVAGGVRYAISEPDTLGAIASVDQSPVTILDGQSEIVTVGNDFPTAPEPPVPPEPPVRPPPQPVLPPGTTGPLSGPDLVLAASLLGGADVAVSETISPRVSTVGATVSVTVRVRNYGPLPAVGALAREIPQVDPRRPNQVARILGVRAGPRVAGCTSTRPVSCGGATLPAGAEVVVRVRARMLLPGIYKSVVVATSRTPDPNTTNNLSVNGLAVTRPADVAVGVDAPPVARVGEPVSYRIVARGTGRDGARSVRFCHRPPARLLMTSAPGTFRYRGRVCRDVSRLARGQRAGFTVNALPASSAGGRSLPLRATATAPDARPAAGSARIAVVAQSFVGTG